MAFNLMVQQCYMQVLNKDGQPDKFFSAGSFHIEHICKGGFRFLSNEKFDVEDRVQVELSFPDKFTQKVFGRICYRDTIDADRTVYGFSVIKGFYSSRHFKDCA